MYSDPKTRFARDGGNGCRLLTPFVRTMPSVDSMNTELTTLLPQDRYFLGMVPEVVRSGATRSLISGDVFSWLSFKRNQKVSSGKTILDCQVPLERFPEVFCPAGVNQRKRCDRQPTTE